MDASDSDQFMAKSSQAHENVLGRASIVPFVRNKRGNAAFAFESV